MSKTRRFLIVIAVLAVAFMFLFRAFSGIF